MNRKIISNLILVSILVLLASITPSETARARSGGPETSGYVFVDSDETDGPIYNLEDISSSGTRVTLDDDAVSGAINIGFPFKFFGVEYSQVYISSNGFITFLTNQNSSPDAQLIPNPGSPNAVIAGWWADLKPRLGGSITYQTVGTAPDRRFIVQFQEIYSAALNRVTFEIKLFETGQAIEVHYDSAPPTDSDGVKPNTAGIENENGQLGLQYTSGVEGLPGSLAVRYTPFVGVALEPESIISYAQPGETKIVPLSVYNWTGQDDTFHLSLTPTHGDWTYRILPSDTIEALPQGLGADLTIEIDFPPGAEIADYFAFDLTANSTLGMPGSDPVTPWSDTSQLIVAVPRPGYIFNLDRVSIVDTQFHQEYRSPLIVDENVGVFLIGGTLSPDGRWLYGLLAGGQTIEGDKLVGRVLVYDLEDLSIPPIPIDVGNDASSFSLTPDGKQGMVTSFEDGTVSVLDTDPASPTYLTVTNTISVGSQPIRVVTSPCLDKAYLTSKEANTMTVLDLSSLAPGSPVLTSTIPGFDAPWGVVVAPSGELAYVTNNGNGRIDVIDTVRDVLLTSWSVSGTEFQDLDINPSGSRLYAVGSEYVMVVNTTGEGGQTPGSVVTTIPIQSNGLYSVEIFPAEISPNAYVSNGGVQSVSVLDTDSNTLVYTIPMAGSPVHTGLFPPETECPYPPVAYFAPTQAVAQVGVPFTFTDKSIRNPTSYDWDFGDNTPHSHEANPSHTYTAAGTYTVTLTATNAFGSGSTTGTVHFKPKASFTPALSVINLGDPVNFIDTSTGNSPMTYSWNFGDGTAASTEANPSHTYASIGNYAVTLTVTNGYGSDTATGQVVFVPKAEFTPLNSIIQAGDTLNFINASTGTTPLNYTWDFGDGSPTSSAVSPSHTYSTAGSYQVRLTAENAWASHSVTGTVNFRPKAGFSPIQSKIKPGDSVDFINSSSGTDPLTYTWDFGDGSTSSVANPSHTYETVDNYPVTLKVDNAYGSDVAAGSVVFPPIAAFTQSSQVIHIGESVSFTNQTIGTAPISYTWDFGDGSTSQETNPVHTYLTAGAFTVRLTAANEFGSSQATSSVNFAPTALFSPEDAVIQFGDALQFTNASTGTVPISYLWDFGDGTTSSQANPSHTYAATGTYAVTLTVTNAYGNASTSGTVNFAPKASFTPTMKVIHIGDQVAFSNTTTGNPGLSYTWDFGDGTPTSSDPDPVHTYTRDGNFTVRLTATNPYGTNSTTGNVYFYPVASFTPTNSTIQLGQPIDFTSQSTGSTPLEYAWDFGDGTTSAQANPSHTYTTAGSYTVKLKMTNSYGSDTATGTVNFAPKAAFTPTNPVIQLGQAVQFTNASTGTATLTYAWNFGDGTTSTQASPSHTYTAAGSYTVTLTVTNTYGQETASGTVRFRPKAAFTLSNNVIQLGDPISTTNQSTGTPTLTYVWDFGDGETSTAASPTHTYAAAGSYTITLQVENTYGSDSVSKTVNFAPKAGFTPTQHVVQFGPPISFTNHSTGTAPLSYAWTFGDGGTSTSSDPTHTYTAVGSYTVRLTVTNAFGTDTLTGTVNFSPKADFTFMPASAIKPGVQVTFTNQSTGTGDPTCTWNFGDGTPETTQTHPKHTFAEPGAYSVRLACHSDSFGDDTIQKEIAVNLYVVGLDVSSESSAGEVFAGDPLTYTAVITNAGPDDLINATVRDLLSDWLDLVSWTCEASTGSTCPAEGSGNLMQDTVTIQAGGSLTYSISAVVKPGMAGVLSNTVTVIMPPYCENTAPGSDSSTVEITVWGKVFLPLVRR